MASGDLRHDPIEKFWRRVRISDGCWEWLGDRLKSGYGRMQINRRSVVIHRFSWELHYGPIPYGLCVCHHCDNRCCVRPDHLFLGTNADNTRDKTLKGRAQRLYGETNGACKLTAEQVLKIRDLYRSGLTTRQLRNVYSAVTQGAIRHIVTGRTWTHLNARAALESTTPQEEK